MNSHITLILPSAILGKFLIWWSCTTVELFVCLRRLNEPRRLDFQNVVGIRRRRVRRVLEMHAVDGNMSRQTSRPELNTRAAVEWHMWRRRRRRRRPTPHTSFSRRRWSVGIRRRLLDASRRDSIDQVLRRCRPAGHRTAGRLVTAFLSQLLCTSPDRTIISKESTVWKSSVHISRQRPRCMLPALYKTANWYVQHLNAEVYTTTRFTSIGHCRWKPTYVTRSAVTLILRSRMARVV